MNVNYLEGSPWTASSQRSTIDVQTWTLMSNPPQKYGGLRGCSATIAGDARSSAAFLLDEFADV